jgi:Site-specific recombinase XerD
MNALVPIQHKIDVGSLKRIRDSYTRNFRDFTRWLDEREHPFNYDGVEQYFTWLNKESGYSASTICVRRAAVKRRLRQYMLKLDIDDPGQYAEHQRFETHLKRLDAEPKTAAPKIQQTSVDETKIITSEEYWRMKANCTTAKQLVLIQFLYSSGVRISELCGIKIGHCKHVKKGIVKIRILGKGKKQRDIIVSETLFDQIMDTYAGEEYLFETSHGKAMSRGYASTQIVRKIAKKALGRSFGAHVLRHSFSTRMIKKTNAPEAVSRYIGHSSVSLTLSLYCHRTLSVEDLLTIEEMEGEV